jgi:hypothetical protein
LEIVHAPNLKSKIGAGYAHCELEKLWRESEPKKFTVAQSNMRFFLWQPPHNDIILLP